MEYFDGRRLSQEISEWIISAQVGSPELLFLKAESLLKRTRTEKVALLEGLWASHLLMTLFYSIAEPIPSNHPDVLLFEILKPVLTAIRRDLESESDHTLSTPLMREWFKNFCYMIISLINKRTDTVPDRIRLIPEHLRSLLDDEGSIS